MRGRFSLTPLVVLVYDLLLLLDLCNFLLGPLCFFPLRRKSSQLWNTEALISSYLNFWILSFTECMEAQHFETVCSCLSRANAHTPCTRLVASCSSGRCTVDWLSWPSWGRSPASRCSQDSNWPCQTLTDTCKTQTFHPRFLTCVLFYV